MSIFRVLCLLVLFVKAESAFCTVKGGHAAASLSPVHINEQESSCAGHAQLNEWESRQFVEAADGKRAEVFAQFLSEKGCGAKMLEGLRSVGATVRYADERSGYALISILQGKLLATLDIQGIEYAYTSDDRWMYYQDPAAKIPQSERKPEPVPQIAIPYPRVATTLPQDGPFFDADVIGLTELWKEHPEADGRGVTVAVSDQGFDLLHPALQQARNADGSIVPKVADLGTLTSPDEDSGWVRFGAPIQTKDGSFDAAGRIWIAPQDGIYRFGIFKQDLFLGPKDNSHTRKLSLSVGVLWDERSGHVWVDTDGDGSFKKQRALGDYGATHDIDWFGSRQGDEDNRIPFGVKIEAAHNAVYIRIGGEHGAFVAGPLAANRLSGGLFDGSAPSAQLVDSNSYRVEGNSEIVAMFARPDVAVLNRSGGLGRAYERGDFYYFGREDFAQRVVEREIAIYDKPIATVSAATGTINVNDYAGPEMLKRNRQLRPPYRDSMNSGVPFLPNGLVNIVMAPSANLETESRYDPFDILWPDGKKHSFTDHIFSPPAPDGYMIGDNNSPAIPVVSGVLADLIGEAKRKHVRCNATRLNNAIFTGTTLLDGFPISMQGYGLINAAQSWDQLAKMAEADDPKYPELTSFTVSRMEDGQRVKVQGFQADLPNARQKLDGEIWITRHGGYVGSRKYAFSLRGNNGSFELLDHEATLERDKPERVRFRTSGKSGWNVVFLELRDARAKVVMQDVPLSVRVPGVPDTIAPGVDKYEATIPPLRSEYKYVRAGDDVQAIRYVMRIPYTGPSQISTRAFPGFSYNSGPVFFDTRKIPPGEPVDAAHHVGPMETLESLVVNDEPGAQQIFWENSGRPEYATQYDGPAPDVPIHAELRMTKYAVAIEKGASDTLNVTNKLADIDGKVEFYDATLKISQLTGTGLHASGEMERTLPAILRQWRVHVTSDAPSSQPADVYLLNCSGKDGCSVEAQQEVVALGKTVVIDEPQAGDWKIVVRSRDQVKHPVSYSIREALLTPAAISVESADSQHASETSWTISLPKKQSDAQYAAFRIAGTPGVSSEKNGLVIAMTPLDGDAP